MRRISALRFDQTLTLGARIMVRNAAVVLFSLLALTTAGARGTDNDRGDYEKPLVTLNAVIQQHPQSCLALGLRAQLCGKRGEWDQVITDCTAVLQQNPDSLQYLILRLQAYFEKKDMEHALTDANEVLRQLKPRNAEDYRLRGELHRLRAMAKEDHLQRLLHDNLDGFFKETFDVSHGSSLPPDPSTPIKADREQALADYAEALRLAPTHVETYRARARAYLEQQDYNRAIVDLAAVIHLRGNDSQAYCDRAEAYYERGRQAHYNYFAGNSSLDTHAEDYRLAIADYTAALRLKPGDVRILRKRAKIYLSRGADDKTIADCNEMLRLQPGNKKDAYRIRALAYRNSKDYDRAITDCTELIRLSSRDPERQCWIGERATLYEKKGDRERALADYTENIRLEPGDSIPYLSRAEFFVRQMAFDEALADYGEAIRIDTKRGHLQYWIGNLHGRRARVYLWKRDFDAAVAELTNAIEHNPQEGDLYAWRALVHVLRGERDPALADCRAAAEQYVFRHNRRALRAALLIIQGNYRQALADFLPQREPTMGMGMIPSTLPGSMP